MGNSISTLGQTIENNLRLKTMRYQLDDLQRQLTSQKKAETFSGLGDQAIKALRARNAINQTTTYQTNISNGMTRLKTLTDSLKEFRAQTNIVLDALTEELQKGDINLDQIQDFARSALSIGRDLLNTKDGDRYLLSGGDAENAPIDKNGVHEVYMRKLFDDWQAGTITTDTLMTNYKSTSETTMGYSAALSSGSARHVYVRADVTVEVDTTLFANQDGFKKILNGLALLDQMDIDKISLGEDDNPATTQTAPGADAEEQRDNFFELYEDIIKHIKDGVADLNREEQRLERANLTLDTVNKSHTTDKVALENLVSDVEDADTSDVAIRISVMQVQLSAAYQVTARIGQLTLSNFI